MENSDDIFLKKMKGVNPIKKNNRVRKEIIKKQIKNIKENKVKKEILKTRIVGKNTKKSEFNLENINIKKNIKRGSFKINKRIDFHGKNLIDSQEQFSKIVIKCYNDNERCLLFVTGKGLYKEKKIYDAHKPKLYHGVIRSALTNWIRSKKFSKYILSYEVASKEHGGDGAFYVYLRKKIKLF